MVGGFNHNFRYKEQIFHVQTEDSGVKKSEITTLLYSGGTILARQTTSYAELSPNASLAEQVELRMKDQHKQMLRQLKSGHYDTYIDEALGDGSQPEKQPKHVEPCKSAQAANKAMGIDELIFAYLTAGR
ncbi:MAG: hypothetical protein B6I37_06950 [Desulfobacteraceae bacterium 4572_35.2]|nr:MAG: hypothetical protein B6I37_06950 [Desulfobacteraceae bacterium 4572_35.2]